MVPIDINDKVSVTTHPKVLKSAKCHHPAGHSTLTSPTRTLSRLVSAVLSLVRQRPEEEDSVVYQHGPPPGPDPRPYPAGQLLRGRAQAQRPGELLRQALPQAAQGAVVRLHVARGNVFTQ